MSAEITDFLAKSPIGMTDKISSEFSVVGP